MKKYLVASLCLILAACAAGPDYEQPQTSVTDEWHSDGGAAQTVQAEWWKVFKDPLLEQFILEAVTNNNDLQAATANVRRARALRRESAGAFFPQVDAGAAGVKSDDGDDTSTLYDAGFDASWEIDIFGGTRRSVEAAEARTDSAIADHRSVMLAVLSEVARNYYDARGLQKRIAITEQNAGLLKQTSDLIRARFEAGESSDFDLARSEGEYKLTLARVPNLNADLKASIFNLSVLLGKPPEALLETMAETQPLPTPPDLVPVGLRSELLRRRPDVQSAERQLAASVADIGVETSELFPKFFLTGDIGTDARVFSDLFSNGLWSLGALVQWSVFKGGAVQARIEAAEAGSEAALANYEQAVLEALRDAETALTRYGEEIETRKRLEEGVQSRRKAVELARGLFGAGEEDFLAVLDSERELTGSEDSLVVSETQSITKLIALYTALGGGWEVFAEEKMGPEQPQ
jgi:multidrug efflux system outer membrane protein